MVRPQAYPGHSKFLLNENSRISTCVCCCPNLPATLYVHAEPNKESAGCEDDTGLSSVAPLAPCLLLGEQTASHCNDWIEDPLNEHIFSCYSGGPPPVTWGFTAAIYCIPTSVFRVDLCFDTPAAPDDINICAEKLTAIVPTEEVTCNASPGEFLLDLGNITPLASTSSACTCSYHFWIDEVCDITPEANPVYFYPWEGSAGFGFSRFNYLPSTIVGRLNNSLSKWEFDPDIGTPLNWHVESSLATSEEVNIPQDLREMLEKSWHLDLAP